jgi:hypothetical protein
MIVMINGSFGVGKTTVARLLRKALPGSAIYDPEWVGYILRRLPQWIALKGSGTDDYQDIDLWRRGAVMGTRIFRFFTSGIVIVPMTFSNRTYFDEITEGIQQFEPELRVFCLIASDAVIKKRLAGRGTAIEGTGAAWITRRVRECVAAHRDAHFGEFIDTEARLAHEVAADIIQRLG